MNRLTKKNNGTGSWTQFGDKYLPAHNIKHKQCVNKLGQLEDIEEELGIDLITLFELLKNGFYFKYKDKIINSNDYICEIRVNLRGNWVCDIMSNKLALILLSIKFKDYGVTWALTSEELELKEKE